MLLAVLHFTVFISMYVFCREMKVNESSVSELINLHSFGSQLYSLNSSVKASLIMVNDSTFRFSMTQTLLLLFVSQSSKIGAGEQVGGKVCGSP